MKALSLIQPWAWAVARGHKHIENRVWTWLRNGLPALRRQVAENERIAIHASSTKPRVRDIVGVSRALGMTDVEFTQRFGNEAFRPGVITATCTVDDVLRCNPSDLDREHDDDQWPLYGLRDEDRDRYLAGATGSGSLEFRRDQLARWWLGPYALVLGSTLAVPTDRDPVFAIGRQLFWRLHPETLERLQALGVA